MSKKTSNPTTPVNSSEVVAASPVLEPVVSSEAVAVAVSEVTPVEVKTEAEAAPATPVAAPAPRRRVASTSRRKTPAVVAPVEPVVVAAVEPEPVVEAKPSKEKSKKAKMVRDGFTMPEQEYQQLGDLKKKCLKAGIAVKKSELLRIGLQQLALMPEQQLFDAVEKLEKIKTGRPSKKA